MLTPVNEMQKVSTLFSELKLFCCPKVVMCYFIVGTRLAV